MKPGDSWVTLAGIKYTLLSTATWTFLVIKPGREPELWSPALRAAGQSYVQSLLDSWKCMKLLCSTEQRGEALYDGIELFIAVINFPREISSRCAINGVNPSHPEIVIAVRNSHEKSPPRASL